MTKTTQTNEFQIKFSDVARGDGSKSGDNVKITANDKWVLNNLSFHIENFLTGDMLLENKGIDNVHDRHDTLEEFLVNNCSVLNCVEKGLGDTALLACVEAWVCLQAEALRKEYQECDPSKKEALSRKQYHTLEMLVNYQVYSLCEVPISLEVLEKHVTQYEGDDMQSSNLDALLKRVNAISLGFSATSGTKKIKTKTL